MKLDLKNGPFIESSRVNIKDMHSSQYGFNQTFNFEALFKNRQSISSLTLPIFRRVFRKCCVGSHLCLTILTDFN